MIFFSFFQMNRVQPPCNMGTAPTSFHSVFWVYLWLLILMVWFTIRRIFEKLWGKNPSSDEPFNEEILLLQTHFGCKSFGKKLNFFVSLCIQFKVPLDNHSEIFWKLDCKEVCNSLLWKAPPFYYILPLIFSIYLNIFPEKEYFYFYRLVGY